MSIPRRCEIIPVTDRVPPYPPVICAEAGIVEARNVRRRKSLRSMPEVLVSSVIRVQGVLAKKERKYVECGS